MTEWYAPSHVYIFVYTANNTPALCDVSPLLVVDAPLSARSTSPFLVSKVATVTAEEDE